MDIRQRPFQPSPLNTPPTGKRLVFPGKLQSTAAAAPSPQFAAPAATPQQSFANQLQQQVAPSPAVDRFETSFASVTPPSGFDATASVQATAAASLQRLAYTQQHVVKNPPQQDSIPEKVGIEHVQPVSGHASDIEKLEPMIHEVAQIAERSGFIGLTSKDVMRAYAYGTSLLADYSV